MSGLPAQFPCPWCGMSYPAKPVLVGKAVRCKGCKNGFILQADGVAQKIQDSQPANPTVSQVSAAAPAPAPRPEPKPAPAPAPRPEPAPAPRPEPKPVPTPAPAPRPEPKPAPAPAPAPAPRPEPKPVPPPTPKPASRPAVQAVVPDIVVEDVVVLPQRGAVEPPKPTPKPPTRPEPKPEAKPEPKPEPKSDKVVKKKTEQLEAARAQMAAQLAEVAAKAAESEAARREERKEKTETGRTAKPSSGAAAKSVRTAVLTGEGDRHHAERRLWWLWLGIAAAIVLLLLFVFSMRSTTRAALDLYAAPVSADQNRYPVLGDVLRARAWLAAAQSMSSGPVLATDLSDATFGAEHAIELAPLGPKLAELKGLRLEPTFGVWLAPGDMEKARQAVGGKTGAEAVKAIAAARIRHAVHSQVVQGWSLSEEDAGILLDLLTGVPPKDGEPIAKRILDQGEAPDRLVVRPFRGRNGSMLVDIGRPPYRPVQGPYTGLILRFEGARWPIGWKVLHLNQVK